MRTELNLSMSTSMLNSIQSAATTLWFLVLALFGRIFLCACWARIRDGWSYQNGWNGYSFGPNKVVFPFEFWQDLLDVRLIRNGTGHTDSPGCPFRCSDFCRLPAVLGAVRENADNGLKVGFQICKNFTEVLRIITQPLFPFLTAVCLLNCDLVLVCRWRGGMPHMFSCNIYVFR